MFSSLKSPLDVVKMSPVGGRDNDQIYILILDDFLICLYNLDVVANN